MLWSIYVTVKSHLPVHHLEAGYRHPTITLQPIECHKTCHITSPTNNIAPNNLSTNHRAARRTFSRLGLVSAVCSARIELVPRSGSNSTHAFSPFRSRNSQCLGDISTQTLELPGIRFRLLVACTLQPSISGGIQVVYRACSADCGSQTWWKILLGNMGTGHGDGTFQVLWNRLNL